MAAPPIGKIGAGCKRKNRLFKQFQTAEYRIEKWNESKEVLSDQGSKAPLRITPAPVTAGISEIGRRAGAPPM
jgi:hypothetical protein